MHGQYVSYLRVSTDKQGKSGLGLEAQRAAVTAFLGGGKPLAEMLEVESGSSSGNRPQLAAAMERCRLTGATLLVAKLDRLSRDAHFLLGLQKAADVQFEALDTRGANRFTVGVMALVAQQEREAISARTKAALAAAKARGVKLGGYRGGPVPDGAKAKAACISNADAFAARVGPLARELQASGLSLEATARELTTRGIKTARGGAWTGQAVKNLLARREAQP